MADDRPDATPSVGVEAKDGAPCDGAGKPGAPRGNANALRTGARMDVYRLAVGGFAKPLSRVERSARSYRRDLEAA